MSDDKRKRKQLVLLAQRISLFLKEFKKDLFFLFNGIQIFSMAVIFPKDEL